MFEKTGRDYCIYKHPSNFKMKDIEKMKKIVLFLLLLFLISGTGIERVGADPQVTDVLWTRLNDMHRDYQVFLTLQEASDREIIAKRMEHTARDYIQAYYQQIGDPTESQKDMVAEAFLLLALVEYQVENPTVTHYALEIATRINPGAVEKVDSLLRGPYKERFDRIQNNWLSRYKKCNARVYGFPENSMVKDTLTIGIGTTHLANELREDNIFKAIDWAQEHLNRELHRGQADITLLLPPGNFVLEVDNQDVYPARFEVTDTTNAVFDVTPNCYFNLRVFYCRDSIFTRLDTVFSEATIETTFLDDSSANYLRRPRGYQNYLLAEVDTTFGLVKRCSTLVQRVPLSPKDVDIWKGDKRLFSFDRLAFGSYEFAVKDSDAVPDEYKFKRFLPASLNWDIPEEDEFVAEDIFVKDKDNYNYCIDLGWKERKAPEVRPSGCPPCPKCPRCPPVEGPSLVERFMFFSLMVGSFVVFLHTIK
jgi:hypothetical protein